MQCALGIPGAGTTAAANTTLSRGAAAVQQSRLPHRRVVVSPRQGSPNMEGASSLDSGQECRRGRKSGRTPASPITDRGVIFDGIICDACGLSGILGVRWKCEVCVDYDLCSACYMAGKHAPHAFTRFDRPRDRGIRVPPRRPPSGVQAGGMVHEGINCDACGERGIFGTRWKCLLCFDYDLCGACYMGGRHNQEHAFLRLNKPGGTATRVPPRKTTARTQLSYLEPGGVTFDNLCCDSCGRGSFFGPRWKCDVCAHYDLCARCYLSDVHNLDHAFVRFDRPGGRGIRVCPRQQSTELELKAMLHEEINCDACGELGIFGKRWKCQLCIDYDLCTACYMAGKHDRKHPFLRIDKAGCMAVKLAPRDTNGRAQVSCPATEAVRFDGVQCDGCGQSAFAGARWKCDVCTDYDLCTPCYLSNKHNFGHVFVRFDRPQGEGIRVSSKRESSKVNTAGISHTGIYCDACGERGIIGTRWKCELCYDYDLCTPCYARGEHNQEHTFLRLNNPGDPAINVPPRKASGTSAVSHLPTGGIQFNGITCKVCGRAEISGTRWKCDVCVDYDLCAPCYVSNKHNLTHSFVRFDRPRGSGIKVSPKQGSTEPDGGGISHGGVIFIGITCDVCDEQNIVGTRWKCAVCRNCDLCTTCYAEGKHDISHVFMRIEVPGSRGVRVPPRQQPTRTQPECTGVEDTVDQGDEQRNEKASTSHNAGHAAQAELETKLQELESALQCVICMEGRRNVAFLCGHSACAACAENLRICHMCRVPITKRITLY
ncbi:uncharacterized protein LOC119446117 isoform X2 [Dermacentor silvarum]|uniref:uncharacterized protein LOC119446117 isoform X2 n=2 Tax=Dermacentor silvarum TaxID=543639 RepID=UPI0021009C9E|nr:uncharacterized protein LOC119446117 isoform X2 [Dermacentor silvarum]